MVTCKMKIIIIIIIILLFYYFNLCRRPSEIILLRRVDTRLKLFQNYFRSLPQLTNVFRHVEYR